MRALVNRKAEIGDKRLVTFKNGAPVFDMGVSAFRKWAYSIGAVVAIGGSRRVDLQKMYEDIEKKRVKDE